MHHWGIGHTAIDTIFLLLTAILEPNLNLAWLHAQALRELQPLLSRRKCSAVIHLGERLELARSGTMAPGFELASILPVCLNDIGKKGIPILHAAHSARIDIIPRGAMPVILRGQADAAVSSS